MSYYFVTNIKIKNNEGYQKYLDKADEVFEKFDGKYLAVDGKPKVIEGRWNYTRAVIIEFKTKSDFEKWYYSKEYQEILNYRLNNSDCDTILVKGK